MVEIKALFPLYVMKSCHGELDKFGINEFKLNLVFPLYI